MLRERRDRIDLELTLLPFILIELKRLSGFSSLELYMLGLDSEGARSGLRPRELRVGLGLRAGLREGLVR